MFIHFILILGHPFVIHSLGRTTTEEASLTCAPRRPLETLASVSSLAHNQIYC